MKSDEPVEKTLERVRSLTLARIVARKRPQPTQVMVTAEGKVRVETRYSASESPVL